MTEDQVRRVQDSFQNVLPISDRAAALFYGRLFEIDPTAKSLFAATDMAAQGGKLMAAIAMVVGALDKLERIVPAAEAMARRHVGYGVTAAHYATVGAALLWTLGQGLGAAFDAETDAAWGAAYGLLSGVMIAAANA